MNSDIVGNSTHMTGAAYRKIGPAVAPRAADCLTDAEIEQQRARLDGLLERNAITAITHREDVADIESRRCPPDTPDMGVAAPDAGNEDADSEQDPAEPEKRLEQLKRLHERGLITDEEYEAKRAQILESL